MALSLIHIYAPGSFQSATAAIGHLKNAGLLVTANTHINRVNRDVLEKLFEHLRGQGIRAWQVQITVPLGRAADRPQMLLQPWDLLDVVPRIAALKRRAFAAGITVMPGNNLGYFGVDEALLRTPHPIDNGNGGPPEAAPDHWQGCQAGRMVMGIESDGGVKGCPSLQSHYIGGSLKDRTLAELWWGTEQLAFNRSRSVDDLWGFCASCPFASTCKGGCTFTAHAVLGRPGNNPYCVFRASQLKNQGLRERLIPTQAAEGKPFDHGLFELVVEDFNAPEPPAPPTPEELVAITRRARRSLSAAA